MEELETNVLTLSVSVGDVDDLELDDCEFDWSEVAVEVGQRLLSKYYDSVNVVIELERRLDDEEEEDAVVHDLLENYKHCIRQNKDLEGYDADVVDEIIGYIEWRLCVVAQATV